MRLKDRKGQDIYLDELSSDRLKGMYENTHSDTIYDHQTLYNNFNYDTLYQEKGLLVEITPIDKNTLDVALRTKTSTVDAITLKGRYRKGYFKVRTKVEANFIAGPLLWVLAENKTYIGLSQSENLVVMNSGGSGLLLLVVMPIFAAGGGQTEYVYEKVR